MSEAIWVGYADYTEEQVNDLHHAFSGDYPLPDIDFNKQPPLNFIKTIGSYDADTTDVYVDFSQFMVNESMFTLVSIVRALDYIAAARANGDNDVLLHRGFTELCLGGNTEGRINFEEARIGFTLLKRFDDELNLNNFEILNLTHPDEHCPDLMSHILHLGSFAYEFTVRQKKPDPLLEFTKLD